MRRGPERFCHLIDVTRPKIQQTLRQTDEELTFRESADGRSSTRSRGEAKECLSVFAGTMSLWLRTLAQTMNG
jgi:hypothetical protein